MTQLYTSSRIRTIRSCLRLHMYKYVLAIRGAETAEMGFGTVGHKALEAYYLAWQNGELDQRLPAALAQADGLPEFDRTKLRVLLIAYDLRWRDEPWDVLAVEEEFRYELGGYEIGGKIDAIVRDQRDGRVFVLEHKTTGAEASLGSTYWERLAIDAQVSVYVDGATMLGHEVSGCIYDVLKRPAHEQKLATPPEEREYTKGRGCPKCGGSAKPGAIAQGRGFYIVAGPGEAPSEIPCDGCASTGWKLDKDGRPDAPHLYAKQRENDESPADFEARVLADVSDRPDEFLMRGTVVRLGDELEPMREDLIASIKIERAAALLEVAPRNPDACAKFGRMCEFFDACSGRASIDDEILFPRGRAHPELGAA